jgi:hypothetical protein
MDRAVNASTQRGGYKDIGFSCSHGAACRAEATRRRVRRAGHHSERNESANGETDLKAKRDYRRTEGSKKCDACFSMEFFAG